MKIELLCIDECPNVDKTEIAILKVLSSLDIAASVRKIVIRTPQEAAQYRFLGSPSIQINGTDIEPSRRNDSPVLGCRIYRENQHASGTPSEELIRAAVQEAAARADIPNLPA